VGSLARSVSAAPANQEKGDCVAIVPNYSLFGRPSRHALI
jgi:hypothetical protein